MVIMSVWPVISGSCGMGAGLSDEGPIAGPVFSRVNGGRATEADVVFLLAEVIASGSRGGAAAWVVVLGEATAGWFCGELDGLCDV